jgi:hypothetical protein
VAKLEHQRIRTKDGIDGLLIWNPGPTVTWRDLPDNSPADEQFTEA